MSYTRIFIHGLESSRRGTKGTYFTRHIPGMIVDDFPGGFTERMTKLKSLLADSASCILVGSSYGGLMATVYALEHPLIINRLILLAPALTLPELDPSPDQTINCPVILYHGDHDDVVPPDAVRSIAERLCTNLDYHRVDDDHSLHRTFSRLDWEALLLVDK